MCVRVCSVCVSFVCMCVSWSKEWLEGLSVPNQQSLKKITEDTKNYLSNYTYFACYGKGHNVSPVPGTF